MSASSPSTTAPHLEIGRAAEAAAARHLERAGYRILGRNFRARVGEIDLVAMDGPALAIVEVRYRASDRCGGGAASITAAKRRRIVRAARVLLAATGRWRACPRASTWSRSAAPPKTCAAS